MADNVINFNQHFHSLPLGSTIAPIPIKDTETEEDFMFEICHKLCAELWDDFEWGQKPEFDFDELVEFAKTLLLKTALWNASEERLEYLKLKEGKN